MERPPLNALQVFVTAARAKNMTRAAERLHLTVSALSHQVRTLEQRCHRRLPGQRRPVPGANLPWI